MLGFVLATAALAIPAATQAQKPVPRIAYVDIFKEGPSAPFSQEFRQRLRELGWIEDKNIVVDVRDAEGSPDKLNAIMRELVDPKVDVIVTACTPEAKVAVKYTSTIPIVMAATGDPVAAGLVANLAKPGGNVTGVSAMLLDLSAKRMEILHDAFPKITRATVIWNPSRPDNIPGWIDVVRAELSGAASPGSGLRRQDSQRSQAR
jgi:putative ABC transport system substrate-binding protein